MKFLQRKVQKPDEFTTFLQQCEAHQVCRKLQLKDFIPNEVQRLTKYSLLFDLLTRKVESK